ncbi:FCD domain-containing protein [Brucellaceae bacterium C25G]
MTDSNPSTIFTSIKSSKTSDEVVHQIEALILEGVLRGGDRLPSEREMALQFDVSRPILRDALKHLELSGLVTTRHGDGTCIANVIGQVFSEPVVRLFPAHHKAAADYLEYRREIESITAQYAAERATNADKALLTRLMQEMEKAHTEKDYVLEAKLDVEFHNAVGECAHNIVLLHTLRSCYQLLNDGVFYNRSIVYDSAESSSRLLDQHKAIYLAIIAGDKEAAAKAAASHISFLEIQMDKKQRAMMREKTAQLRALQRGVAT